MNNLSGDNTVNIEVVVRCDLKSAWDLWTDPAHVIHWNAASDDWHTPRAKSDLKPGGRFVYRMESRDGKMGFDFGGVYDKVVVGDSLAYTLDDGRKARIEFNALDSETTSITQAFEIENTYPKEVQKKGWQAIMNNFKKYAEGTSE